MMRMKPVRESTAAAKTKQEGDLRRTPVAVCQLATDELETEALNQVTESFTFVAQPAV
jgi:hypothetical protein